jgi:dihydroxyacid dehydratase/phosphogluconate dehydratase
MIAIDLPADLNAQDDDGLGWSLLREAADPTKIRPGVYVVAGNLQAAAVVRIAAIDDDGQVHFAVLPGSVRKNSHLLQQPVA